MNSDATPSRDRERKIYRVGEITRLIKLALEEAFGEVWIEGEISNFHRHSSGHIYFTLKDERAQIAAAWFRGSQQRLDFELKDGLLVRAYGQVTAYEGRSQYQLVVRRIEEAGKGSLQEAFEKLKLKLAGEGLFAPERKKLLPVLPQHIGIVTSPTGAAIRDILNVLSRRFPNLHIIIAPVRVQGEGAAQEIADAIGLFNRLRNIDVMIVGRGGGSLEDLWCFNEEIVARAIAASEIPIISAVGHETDFTISDFVADLRAPTPSAAAELVVQSKEAFEEQVRQAARHLARALQTHALQVKNRLTAAAGSYVFREPANLVRQYRERLQALGAGILRETTDALNRRQQRLDELGLRLSHRIEIWKGAITQDLRRLASQLRALAPQAVLERGFSITRGPDGRVLKAAEQVKAGDALTSQLASGTVTSTVTGIERRSSRQRKGQP